LSCAQGGHRATSGSGAVGTEHINKLTVGQAYQFAVHQTGLVFDNFFSRIKFSQVTQPHTLDGCFQDHFTGDSGRLAGLLQIVFACGQQVSFWNQTYQLATCDSSSAVKGAGATGVEGLVWFGHGGIYQVY